MRVFAFVIDRYRQQVAHSLSQPDFGRTAPSQVIVARGHEQLNNGTLERIARGRDECSRHRIACHVSEALRFDEDLNELCVPLKRSFGGNA